MTVSNGPSNLVILWPELESGWVLEQSSRLESIAPWSRVPPDQYGRNGVLRLVAIPAQNESSFFRLRKVGLVVPGLTGYWPLDEAAGPFSSDGSGFGAQMILFNASWSSGRMGTGSLHFNGGAVGAGGSRAWVSNTGYRVLPPTGRPFSVSFWLSPDIWKMGWQGLMGNDPPGTNGWHLALYTPALGTNFLVFAGSGPGGSLDVAGQTLLLPGQWRQLTATYDGQEGRLYLDSALLVHGLGALETQDGLLYFGGGAGGYDSFAGRLDDLRTYTNCLTPEQISLAGHWRLDEGAGGFAADSSIQGHHGNVTNTTAWTMGHDGSGLELSANQLIIRNNDFVVLPGSGGSFSLSCWVRPHQLVLGRSGLMTCGVAGSNGWQLSVRTEASGDSWLEFCSTNNGGTLELSAPAGLANDVWSKLDLTFNGGIGNVYVNGRPAGSASGAILGSSAPLRVGAASGGMTFDGVIDDLKVYNRERDDTEIGPVGRAMWETVMMNSATNIQLQVFGPPGRPLTCSIVPMFDPTNGTVTHLAGSTVVTYQAGGRKGPDAFAYTVSDGEFTTDPIMVAISVVQPHWLSPGGGLTGPPDGSSPDQAWAAASTGALDAIWKTNNYYDCFLYAPGEYHTTGWKYQQRSTANTGCKHIGSGMAGPDRTTIKLADVWEAWTEGEIFSTLSGYDLCDGFEVHQMVLDCNAANVPKYAWGEPVELRIPLATTSLVHTVTLRWGDRGVFGSGPWQLGGAADFSLSARRFGTNTVVTNYTMLAVTGVAQVIALGAVADELVLRLTRRAPGVDFYSLAEVELTGAAASLPTATILPGGGASQLDVLHQILSAVDGDAGTTWVSGPESRVQIALPLERGSLVSQVELGWNCQALAGIGRLGAAASYTIRARDEDTGQYFDVPFVGHGRLPSGSETATFGTSQATNEVRTDQLLIVLAAREATVDRYSLREVTLRHGLEPVPMRLPVARGTTTLSQLFLGLNYGVLRAFDQNTDTEWASGTQGMIGAINVIGNNLKFKNLKIIGYGTKAAKECFPMAVFLLGMPNSPMHLGNVLIEDCTFAQPATNNTDGLTVLLMAANPPDTLTNALIHRCTVAGVRSRFNYSHGMVAVQVEDCVVDDCQVGVYFEPNTFDYQSVGPVVLRRNKFLNVDFGVYLQYHAGAQFDSIACIDNEITLNPGSTWGLNLCDTCEAGQSGTITNVIALNNIVRYPDWLPRPDSLAGAFYYTDMHHAVFGNNVIALGNPSSLRVRDFPAGVIPAAPAIEDCDGAIVVPPVLAGYPSNLNLLPPGYRRVWFNNRELSGALSEVRFKNFGVDGPATQQQSP
jgi:hypothetical protein